MERKSWVERYMREIKSKKRKALLDKAIEEEGMSPENELRLKLFEARYSRIGDQEVDYYIRGWMELLFVKESSKSFFAKKKLDKIYKNLVSDWKMPLIKEYGEIGQTVFYEELFQMLKLYLYLCREDKTYNSVVLGLGRIKKDQLRGKIGNDLIEGAIKAPVELGADRAAEFAMLKEAARDVFCEDYEDECDSFLEKIN